MKKKRSLIDIYIITLISFALICSALRTVALLTDFDFSAGSTLHYENGVVFLISAALCVLSIVLFSGFIFLSPKDFKFAPSSSTPETFIPSAMCAVAFLFMVFTAMTAAIKRFPITDTILKNKDTAAIILHYVAIALAVLALLSAAYFFLNVFLAKRTDTLKAVFGIAVVIFLTLYGAYLYFNRTSHPTNSPNKIIDQMAYFFSALFFLYETRLSLGRDKWRPYVFFGCSAALLCAYSSLPSIIVYFANRSICSDSITESILTLTVCIYITARLILARRLPADSICKEARLVLEYAERREEELAEKRVASRARDYNIMVENGDEAAKEIEERDSTDDSPEGQMSFQLDSTEEE